VYVRTGPDGGWLVELNSDTLPKVLVNQSYHAQVSKTAKNDHDKSYLTDCLQTATWLIRALDQRAKTILKVSTEIVRQQDAFFAHGVQFLRPLNLKTVADAIGMHESTVSRVTANKYMATSRGIFELKYFFTSSINASDGGEAHSAEAVRHRIKQLIDAESAQDVLSDDTIVERLREAGIDIARRTVAKYREAMRIPSSCSDGARSNLWPARHRDAKMKYVVCVDLAIGVFLAAMTLINEANRLTAANLPRPLRKRRQMMPFRVSGKNLDIGEALRERMSARIAEALSKYFDGGYSGHVNGREGGFGFHTECAIHLDSGMTLHADANAADAYASADQAAMRIEKRLRRYKHRLKDHHAARSNGNGAATIDAPSYVIESRPTTTTR